MWCIHRNAYPSSARSPGRSWGPSARHRPGRWGQWHSDMRRCQVRLTLQGHTRRRRSRGGRRGHRSHGGRRRPNRADGRPNGGGSARRFGLARACQAAVCEAALQMASASVCMWRGHGRRSHEAAGEAWYEAWSGISHPCGAAATGFRRWWRHCGPTRWWLSAAKPRLDGRS